MARPITDKQQNYLTHLWRQLGMSEPELSRIPRLTCDQARNAIQQAKNALGQSPPRESPEQAYRRGFEAGQREGSNRAWRAGYEQGWNAGSRHVEAPASLDPELLKRIVALTHPDRHPPERFTEANATTTEVLALRALNRPRA